MDYHIGNNRRVNEMKFTLADATPEEYNAVVKALAEKMKNVIYMSAERRAFEVLDSMKDIAFSVNDALVVKYNFDFLWNDVIEILGGLRRK